MNCFHGWKKRLSLRRAKSVNAEHVHSGRAVPSTVGSLQDMKYQSKEE